MAKTYTFTLTLTDIELLSITGPLYSRIKELEKELAEHDTEWCYARGKQEELEICRQTYEKIYAAIKAEK